MQRVLPGGNVRAVLSDLYVQVFKHQRELQAWPALP